jgi:Na+-driven multidrug efflux pump
MSSATKQEKKRLFILNGSLLKVVYYITAPLAIFAIFNYLYGIVDLALVSESERSAVVFFDELKNAIVAFSAGIATAGSVIAGRHYGANNKDAARQNAGQTFWLNIIICLAVGLIIYVLIIPFMGLLDAPQELWEGLPYFYVQIAITVVMGVTSTFVGMEKVKGNTPLILFLNTATMLVKMVLSLVFLNAMHLPGVWAGIATLISQVIFAGIALWLLFRKKNVLRVRFSDLKLTGKIVGPILLLAIPIFVGKFLFNVGKALINIVALVYGSMVISAFGVMSKFASIFGNIALSFEESQSSIISLNIGNRQLKRAVLSYPISIVSALIIGLIAVAVSTIYHDFFMGLFNIHYDQSPVYYTMVYELFLYERWSCITNAMIGITVSAFVGFKMGFVSTVINIIRIFAIRLPLLYILISFGVDYHSVGMAMLWSNLLTCIICMAMFGAYLWHICKKGYKSGDQLITLKGTANLISESAERQK